MKLLVAKILCMVGVFFFMLLGSLLPVKIIEADFEKAHRSKKVLSLCNTFGGGVFLATCFNALLPAVREKDEPIPLSSSQPCMSGVFLCSAHERCCAMNPAEWAAEGRPPASEPLSASPPPPAPSAPAAEGPEPRAHQHRLPTGRDHRAAGLLHDRVPGAAGPDVPQGEAGLHRPGDVQRQLRRGQRLGVREPLHGRPAGPRALRGAPRTQPRAECPGADALQPAAAPQPGLRSVSPLHLRGPGPGPAGGGGEGDEPVCGRGHPRDAGGRGPGHQHGPQLHDPEGRSQAGGHRERHDPAGHQPRPGHPECPGRAWQRGLRAAAGPGRRHLPLRHLL
nr:zinc transporter ZIP3 isoform X1 [Camelus dromedarius]